MHIQTYFKKTGLLFLVSLMFCSLQAQETAEQSAKKILDRYAAYDSIFERESVYLHIGKTNYQAGENLFFTAYVTDFKGVTAISNRNLYVELINPTGNIVYQKRLYMNDKGMSPGFFTLSDSILAGNYYIRAYTPLQKNFNNNYMFSKPVFITSSLSSYYNPHYLRKLRKERRQADKLSVKASVNGDVLLANTENKIQLQLSNNLGFPVPGNIKIIDRESKTEYSAETDKNGSAIVTVYPASDSRYQIKASSEKQRVSMRLDMPVSHSVKIGSADYKDNQITAHIQSALPETNDRLARTFIILLRVPGQTLNSKVFFLGNESEKLIQVGAAHAGGYAQLILKDMNGAIKSVEKIFLPPKTTRIDYDSVEHNDSIFITLSSEEALRFSAFFGINKEQTSINETLYDYFLYRNRIKQRLNPYVKAEVFQYLISKATGVFLSDFKIDENKELEFPSEKNIAVSGTLYRSLLDLTVPENVVELYILDKHYDRYEAITDDKGRFRFDNLNYRDTIKMRFIAKNNFGKKSFIIDLDKEIIPEFIPYRNSDLTESIAMARQGRRFYRKHLAYTNKKDSVANIPGKVHSRANRVLFFDELNIDGYSSTLRVIETHVMGIRVNSMSTLRGFSSIQGSSEPMYMIDGVPTDKGAVDHLPPETVDRVEILMGGSNSAIYGIRGTNGVVAVYTKRGHNWTPGELTAKMLGYASMKIPQFEIKEKSSEKQLIHYEPSVYLPAKTNIIIGFRKPQDISSLYIDIQGFSESGNPLIFQKKIQH